MTTILKILHKLVLIKLSKRQEEIEMMYLKSYLSIVGTIFLRQNEINHKTCLQ